MSQTQNLIVQNKEEKIQVSFKTITTAGSLT